jgi:hypothetical protein
LRLESPRNCARNILKNLTGLCVRTAHHHDQHQRRSRAALQNCSQKKIEAIRASSNDMLSRCRLRQEINVRRADCVAMSASDD